MLNNDDVSLIDVFIGLALWSILGGGSLLIWLGVWLAARAAFNA